MKRLMKRYQTHLNGVVFSFGLLAVVAATAHSLPSHESVRPQFQKSIPNLPGKSLTALVVSYPPGAKSVAHRHASSAFIYAYVLSGAIRSQLEGEAAKTYHAGESWYEAPRAHHVVSENASSTEPAELLAVFVADSGETELTTPDNH